jgi:NADPH:quinone reductase-like Zn-dependent oxidoreductase
MKAVEIAQFGIEHLRVAERPEPARPGPGQVLVDMKAWSLNYRDYLVARGTYNPKLTLPFVPLSDGAGVVAEVGEGVTRVKRGDYVCGIFMQTWLTGPYEEIYAKSALGGMLEGLLMERVVLPADGLVKAPAGLSIEEAACLPCAAVTAWNALVAQGHLKAGDTVLVQGTGGVSIFALQFAKMHGARVIVTSSSDMKLHRAQGLGADGMINYVQTPDWDKKAKELNGGRGVDHVIEVGGMGTFERSLNATRGGGRISYIGTLTGIQGELKAAWIFHKHLTVQGIYVGSRTMFEDMGRAIAQHGVRPVVDRVFPMAEAPAALRHLESGGHFGKVVLAR